MWKFPYKSSSKLLLFLKHFLFSYPIVGRATSKDHRTTRPLCWLPRQKWQRPSRPFLPRPPLSVTNFTQIFVKSFNFLEAPFPSYIWFISSQTKSLAQSWKHWLAFLCTYDRVWGHRQKYWTWSQSSKSIMFGKHVAIWLDSINAWRQQMTVLKLLMPLAAVTASNCPDSSSTNCWKFWRCEEELTVLICLLQKVNFFSKYVNVFNEDCINF